MKSLLAILLLSLLGAAPCGAQRGTLDVVSPFGSEVSGSNRASFNFHSTSMTWQVEVFAGLDGILEGFAFETTGLPGSYVDAAIYLGSPWQFGTPAWSGAIRKISFLTEVIFVDVSSANITLSAGDAYTIEFHGKASNSLWASGTYEAPVNSFYTPDLFFNSVQYGAEWRLGIHTWMLTGSGLTLSTTGTPGGIMTFDIAGATPSSPLAFLYAFGTGSYSRMNPITGNILTSGLSSAGITLAAVPNADSQGNFSLPSHVPSAAAGLVCVQVVDLQFDGLSNVVSL